MGGATVAREGGTAARGGSSFKHHLLGQQVRDHTLVVSGLASPPKFFFFFFFTRTILYYKGPGGGLGTGERAGARGKPHAVRRKKTLSPRAAGRSGENEETRAQGPKTVFAR